jgi:hypothetical protein
VHDVRKFFSWLFGISSLMCVSIALGSILRIVHRNFSGLPFRALLVSMLFSIMATLFAIACVTGWRGQAVSKGWGLAASMTYILLPILSTIHSSRPFWGSFWLMLAIGIAGLIAFSWPYELPISVSQNYESPRLPGDGTSDLVNRMAGFLIGATTLGPYLWWVGWVRAKGVSENHGKLSRIVLILLVVLVITSLHELAHAATGLGLGMKLRAFVVGPFQWQIREGKWEFKFRAKEILSLQGATGVVSAAADFRRWRYLCTVASGPLVNLLTGVLALWIAFTARAGSRVQAGGFLALFGAWSLVLCALNLVPFRRKDEYSDGAIMFQLSSGGPWTDFRRTVAVIGSSVVTPLRPRDYDIEAILRAEHLMIHGKQGLLLRLYAYTFVLDRDRMVDAAEALREAESIYRQSASNISTELYTVFIFGNAYVRRDAAAAREWWTRMEDRRPARFNSDYWRAKSALHWIEGDLRKANEAWERSNALAQQLPKAGAYEFDRYCCSKLRQALDEVTVVPLEITPPS